MSKHISRTYLTSHVQNMYINKTCLYSYNIIAKRVTKYVLFNLSFTHTHTHTHCHTLSIVAITVSLRRLNDNPRHPIAILKSRFLNRSFACRCRNNVLKNNSNFKPSKRRTSLYYYNITFLSGFTAAAYVPDIIIIYINSL